MVSNVLSLTNNGLRDWLVQRTTAVVLAAYILFLLGFCMCMGPIDYTVWQGLFSQLWMKVFSLLALISMALHAWVGMWTILTDYVKCSVLRISLMVGIIIALFAYIIWGIYIVWGVA